MKTTTYSRLFLAATAACLVASTGCLAEEAHGNVAVSADALIHGHNITRMTLTAQPEGIVAELVSDGAVFSGTLLVPAGLHSFEVRAFAQERQVGFGTAVATVSEGTVTALQITVLDTTGPDPMPDHSPFVRSITLSNAQPKVGESVQLSANVVDPDGDAISYAWTSNCPTSQFSDPSAATVSWVSSQAGACSLRLDIAAGSHTLTRIVNVVVFEAGNASGAVSVSTTFVSNPIIYDMNVNSREDDSFFCSVYRHASDASCQSIARASATFGLSLNTPPSNLTVSFSDNCGGEVIPLQFGGFNWRAPAVPSVCLITGTVTDVHGLTDSLAIAFVVE